MKQYGKLQDGILQVGSVIMTPDGNVHDANADTPTSPGVDWQIVEGIAQIEELDDLGFPVLNQAQVRLGLLELGYKKTHVDLAIAGKGNGKDKDVAEIKWESGQSFHRNHPLIIELAGALGIAEADLDTTWRWAATQ